MTISITINSVDKTSSVLSDTLRITDHINQQVNQATFTTATGYRPNIGEEITITADGVTVFAGVIVKIKQSVQGLRYTYDITCKDYTQYLDRLLVAERYENMTVEDIIADIITNYASGFTTANVACTQSVDTITFNRITVTECIERLSELTNYSWYVDYSKDIHFFSKNTELAPFALTDEGDKHTWNSLNITEDLSKLRNRIYVIGGDIEGNTRTESYLADGEQLQFPLANKFARKPTVTVDSVAQTVGNDFVDDDGDYDCFWSYQEKNIRFKDATKPALDEQVDITGIPLYPIIVNVGDNISINTFGTYEYKIKDTTIQSQDQAIERARVELAAYADALEEGSFVTYESGLRSGQVITIDAAGIQGEYLIQTVNMEMRTESDAAWRVSVASTKTLGIIDFLQKLLRDREITADENEALITFLSFSDSPEVTDSLGTPTTSSPPYLYGPDAGNVGEWNFATYT